MFSIFSILFLSGYINEPHNSTEVLKAMYERYHGKWFSTYKFTQTTERYRNDSLISNETWYETIVYPDLFRIDFGDPKNGNAVIYANDSSYRFQKGKLSATRKDENEVILFLGGMYFQPFEDAVHHFKRIGYDLNKFCSSTWKGKPVYIIGADNPDEKQSQLWIDQEKLVAVRFIKYEPNFKEEGIFEDHKKLAGGLSETKATFYINDKLIQVENYRNTIVNDSIDKRIFDPLQFGK